MLSNVPRLLSDLYRLLENIYSLSIKYDSTKKSLF